MKWKGKICMSGQIECKAVHGAWFHIQMHRDVACSHSQVRRYNSKSCHQSQFPISSSMSTNSFLLCTSASDYFCPLPSPLEHKRRSLWHDPWLDLDVNQPPKKYNTMQLLCTSAYSTARNTQSQHYRRRDQSKRSTSGSSRSGSSGSKGRRAASMIAKRFSGAFILVMFALRTYGPRRSHREHGDFIHVMRPKCRILLPKKNTNIHQHQHHTSAKKTSNYNKNEPSTLPTDPHSRVIVPDVPACLMIG